jgi:heme exporter protein A
LTEPAIRLRKVSRTIDARQVLRDVDLEINEGEFVCLIGANGAGKTTLLNMLAALATPTSGSIELFGKPLTLSATELRSRIGLIGHQPMLYRDLSARENLGFFARLYAIADPDRNVERMLRMIGLADRAVEPVRNFSRGMIQRLSVGRALLHNPSLILADEPFTGLDAPSIESLEVLFGQLRDAGKTIVMVNHDIAQSLRIAERAIVLRHGSIAIDQPTHRLYARELLSEVT